MSKGLGALDKIAACMSDDLSINEKECNDALNIIEDELTALDIMEDRLCKFSFYDGINEDGKPFYLVRIDARDMITGFSEKVSKEIYILLKRVLGQ